MHNLALVLLNPDNTSLITKMYEGDTEGQRFLGMYDSPERVRLVDGVDRFIWIVFEKGVPTGFLDLQKDSNKGYYAYYVAPSFRDKGYARRS